MTSEAPLEPDWVGRQEAALLDQAIRLAPDLGWNGRLAQAAGRAAGLSQGQVAMLLPRGAGDLAALLSRRHDAAAMATLGGIDAQALKVRERIRTAVEARVEAAMADEAAVRRLGGYLVLPTHAPQALALGWGTADGLWRWAGDTATDENHYSKRAILSAVLVSTLAARLAGGRERESRHLSDRIDQVMAFETWKAKRPKPGDWMGDLAGRLGRLRYGER